MHIYCCYTLSTSPVICIPCVARCTKSLSYLPTACCTSYMPRAATPYSVMPILLLHHIHYVMPTAAARYPLGYAYTAAAPYPLGYANCCCTISTGLCQLLLHAPYHILYCCCTISMVMPTTAAAPYCNRLYCCCTISMVICLLLLLHHIVLGNTAAAPYPWLCLLYCCCTISY